jgi:hypothetical protein
MRAAGRGTAGCHGTAGDRDARADAARSGRADPGRAHSTMHGSLLGDDQAAPRSAHRGEQPRSASASRRSGRPEAPASRSVSRTGSTRSRSRMGGLLSTGSGGELPRASRSREHAATARRSDEPWRRGNRGPGDLGEHRGDLGLTNPRPQPAARAAGEIVELPGMEMLVNRRSRPTRTRWTSPAPDRSSRLRQTVAARSRAS